MIFSGDQFSKNRVVSLFVITLMLLLHACGFQLRGTVNLSQDMSPVYIEKNGAFDLAREIKDVLTGNGIKTVDSAEPSKLQLVLLNEAKSRRILSVDGSGRAQEYLLMYSVNFEIKRKLPVAEKVDSKRDTVSMSRALLFDPETVLAVANEAEVIYEDMRRDAARLILLKLQSFSTQMSTTGKAGGANNSSTGVTQPAQSSDPAKSDPVKAMDTRP